MSNPAPTLNQINAFNATQGTTIDFNIIGGTEVIRSNKIYIYDLSDNSLICTHLYVSTESIHELPPNTSSSIVYASGKSSADFTNNTQYYVQIQTFTDVGGTQGGSGLSIAKLFWCLPTPTLTLGTIPTTISTTSYNVSATYTPNTSGGATNEIQEFQFNLYSAIGTLLQTSGVVLYGDGVDLSYNFSGLEVDSTYYVTLDVTTTQGMNVSAQSNTFTVSIDTPTMGSASVVNNGCDGYISVTSNLSSEYSHEQSVDAGEVMSFTTESPNDIKELQVDFYPIQDGTPWMSSTPDTTPYLFRASPDMGHSYNSESDTIVGGSVAWNQLLYNGDFSGGWGLGYHATDLTLQNNEATFTATGSYAQIASNNGLTPIKGHVYLSTITAKCSATRNIALGNGQIGYSYKPVGTSFTNIGSLRKVDEDKVWSVILVVVSDAADGDTITVKEGNVYDLTQMFGSTIADYIYSLEQANAGAGVAWFKKYFPKPYYAYNAGELMSVNASSHDMVGFNAWDEVWEVGAYSVSTGQKASSSANIRNKNIIRVLPNTTYYAQFPSGSSMNGILFYDADKNYLGSSYAIGKSNAGTFTTPTGAYYLNFQMSLYGTTYNNDICINLSWDGERDGEYEEYEEHVYELDPDLELRGIPKLSAGNALYYDGDTYESDGTVTRKYGVKVLNGTENWVIATADANAFFFFDIGPSAINKNSKSQIVSSNFTARWDNTSARDYPSNSIWFIYRQLHINADTSIAPSGLTTEGIAELKSWLSSHPITIVYELATPITETADPYTNPQIVYPNGTEEYVGSPIPVGHKTTYQRICPITGWTGCEVDVSGVNLCGSSLTFGNIDSSGADSGTDARYVRTVGYTNVKPNTTLCFYAESSETVVQMYILQYDINKSILSRDAVYSGSEPVTSRYATFTTSQNTYYIRAFIFKTSAYISTNNVKFSINYPSTDTTYHAHNPNSAVYPVSWQTEAGTVYGGTVDLVTGVLTAKEIKITENEILSVSLGGTVDANKKRAYIQVQDQPKNVDATAVGNIKCNILPSMTANATYLKTEGISYAGTAKGVYAYIENLQTIADWEAFISANNMEFTYELATPITYQLTPHQIQTLVGQNNLWHDTNGEMTIMYQLPITDLLVKRKDVSQVGSQWLTLHSVPVEQASDMDFTYIDFLNQYGKTYQYALVPVLAQNQSGVVVQIEGGYTVSDNVDSIFDGVYIADQTNVERVKAGVGYGNIDMNQGVGSITPIGSKYPIVITNSQNQYHNGSIRGTIVPNNFYSNGNLSRIDMVNKRDELEQFLTNKRAKIIKDWNGKMWLVMIMSNVSCSFDDNYGMGMVSFSADWLEVGDPTNQQDLYNAGLINVGGV